MRVAPPALGFCLVAFVFGSCAAAETPHAVRTILSSGPPADRIDLVVLAEGYTRDQATEFFTDARAVSAGIWSHPLFARYQAAFNVHLVFTPAPGRGILDHDAQRPGGTRFGTHFLRAKTTVVNADWGRVQQASFTAPDVDRILVLCNTDRNVGSRSGNVIFVSRVEPVDTVLHELGHTIGNLADEYVREARWSWEEAVKDLRQSPRPNVAPSTDLKALPWAHWLDGSPVPARPDTQGVSAWEGGYYVRRGVVRPRESMCRMRNFRNPAFCEPCREAIVLGVHGLMRPTQLEQESPTRFRVRTAVPTQTRGVEWSSPGASGALLSLLERASRRNALELDLPPQVITPELELHVSVMDDTPWVRQQRERLRSTARLQLRSQGSMLGARRALDPKAR